MWSTGTPNLTGPSIIGRTLAHYRIDASLGAGGMGEVYRARDTRLGRDVAIKVLPQDVAGDPERLARFQREARAIAALNHPNVVTVYSVEEAENIHFITMELIEGQPLDRLISAQGLPSDRILEIAGAVAEALAAAHEKGIVHRDLKPGNVMVANDGRVKVLDFGLAKDISAESGDSATLTSAGHTQAGVVMGTPAYMSPEQVSGRALDHRSDIFSLGVVLHEMATGHRPFEGGSSAELISSILRDTPPSVTDARPDLPTDLARVIRRCLEKDPRYRMQTARDVSNEFRDLTRSVTRPAPVSTSTARAKVSAESGASRADEGFWVAVLPFKFKGTDAGVEALAEGITEEIINGMSRFPYLHVIAHGSTLRYASQAVDLRQVGKELGARYVMDGSLRLSGSRVRIAAQLIDATTGSQLWAETYDRTLQPEAVFELQDEVVPKIVSTVGDTQGILAQSMSETVWSKEPDRLTPYEAVLRSFSYMRRVNAQNHAAARDALERAVKQAPGNGLAWAMLAIIFREEYNHGFNPRPDPLGRALDAARRAVEAEPSNYLAHHALASVQFYRRELEAFRSETQRALQLNPMDGFTFGYLGMLTAFAGDWERGCSMSEKARRLNPEHPGWYWFAPLFDAFRKQEYRMVLELAQKVNMPNFWRTNLALTATYGHLGESGPARKALQMLLSGRPDFVASAQEECNKWWNPELVDQIMEGLRKAGLGSRDLSAPPLSTGVTTSRTASGESRTDDGFWVAVLPFKFGGNNPDLKALAEGLTEEVITGLSRFSYLRVIARGSSAKYSSESGDVRAIGKELGARYVMEGSLRQAGSKLRLAVQLADTASGAHLWAETYERTFTPESLFEVQDDLVPRVVATVADQYGVLPRTMSEALRSKSEEALTPHEAVLRTFSYFTRLTPDEHATMRRLLERIVREAPDHADSWAMLSMIYRGEHAQRFNAGPNPLDRALAAAQRAVDLAPTHALGHYALATVHFFRKEKMPFRVVTERALALNPMDGSVLAYLGLLMSRSGEMDRGCQMVKAAMRLNPHYPGWFYVAMFDKAYVEGKYAEALEALVHMNTPGYFHLHAARAAALGQLGQREEAQKSLKDLLALRPNFAAEAREEYAKWYDPGEVERMVEGLRKAGLEIADDPVKPAAAKSVASAIASGSGASRAAVREDEGFWVAVLPFKHAGNNSDLAALAEGLTDDIVTNMSKFSYLRVISRSTTTRYAQQAVDVRVVAKELGARFVMEGSIRQAGAKIRIAVQLADPATGASLWAETYDRGFTPDTALDLLDDVVPRIVATVGDSQGILAHSMTEALRNRDPESLTPYEALLRSFGFHQYVDAAEHLAGRTGLERAVKQAPDNADCWAMLSWLYRAEYSHSYNLRADPMERSLSAARRAVELAPSSAFAHAALAAAFFFRRELPAFRSAGERAISLNRMEGYTTAFLGMMFAFSGDWERGRVLMERATQLNPHHPGWYWFPGILDAYRQGDGQRALQALLKVNMPQLWTLQMASVVVHSQLGDLEKARTELQKLVAARPDFGTAPLDYLEKWWQPELVEQMMGDLRKAGLEG